MLGVQLHCGLIPVVHYSVLVVNLHRLLLCTVVNLYCLLMEVVPFNVKTLMSVRVTRRHCVSGQDRQVSEWRGCGHWFGSNLLCPLGGTSFVASHIWMIRKRKKSHTRKHTHECRHSCLCIHMPTSIHTPSYTHLHTNPPTTSAHTHTHTRRGENTRTHTHTHTPQQHQKQKNKILCKTVVAEFNIMNFSHE